MAALMEVYMDKKHDFKDTLLEKEKEILNEISDKNLIYEDGNLNERTILIPSKQKIIENN